jgi:penicillin-binding protein 2
VTAPSSSPPEAASRLRLTAVLIVVICLFAALLGRLWYLQVINAPAAAAVANQGIKLISIPAPRGRIFDRNGNLLVGNRITEVVTVDRDSALANPNLVTRLAALLGETTVQINGALGNPQYSPYQPVPVATGVSNTVMLSIDENQAEFPGVSVQAESVRYYPYGTLAANVLGYVGEITSSEYAALKTKGYQSNDQIGQGGVEATYESYLRGKPGFEKVQVDAQGQVIGELGYQAPVPGDDLILTISATDQQATEKALAEGLGTARTMTDTVSKIKFRGNAGAMVAEDPNTGQILALATYPDYNPNDFVGGISEAKYAAYMNPANNEPLDDRAISGEYAPGSTFKLITATAGLRYGLITPYTLYDDVGGITVGGEHFADDDNSAYGMVDLERAIEVSSDAYFYNLGYEFYQDQSKFGPLALQNVASEYGLGNSTGIPLPGESPGLIPSAAVVAKEHHDYPKAYPDGNWEPGFEIQEAIGENQDLVTPLQMANAYSVLANGGTLYTPQIALQVDAPGSGDKPSGQVIKTFGSQVAGHVNIPDRSNLVQGFEDVVENPSGTANGAFAGFPTSQYPIAGKTGTAQVSALQPGMAGYNVNTYKQDTSVFTSFGPANNPRFVVDGFFEQSGYGASVAAPAVRQVYNTLFDIPAPPTTTTTTSGGKG